MNEWINNWIEWINESFNELIYEHTKETHIFDAVEAA